MLVAMHDDLGVRASCAKEQYGERESCETVHPFGELDTKAEHSAARQK